MSDLQVLQWALASLFVHHVPTIRQQNNDIEHTYIIYYNYTNRPLGPMGPTGPGGPGNPFEIVQK